MGEGFPVLGAARARNAHGPHAERLEPEDGVRAVAIVRSLATVDGVLRHLLNPVGGGAVGLPAQLGGIRERVQPGGHGTRQHHALARESGSHPLGGAVLDALGDIHRTQQPLDKAPLRHQLNSGQRQQWNGHQDPDSRRYAPDQKERGANGGERQRQFHFNDVSRWLRQKVQRPVVVQHGDQDGGAGEQDGPADRPSAAVAMRGAPRQQPGEQQDPQGQESARGPIRFPIHTGIGADGAQQGRRLPGADHQISRGGNQRRTRQVRRSQSILHGQGHGDSGQRGQHEPEHAGEHHHRHHGAGQNISGRAPGLQGARQKPDRQGKQRERRQVGKVVPLE